MVELWRDFWIRETGTPWQLYDDDDDDDDDDDVLKYKRRIFFLIDCWNLGSHHATVRKVKNILQMYFPGN